MRMIIFIAIITGGLAFRRTGMHTSGAMTSMRAVQRPSQPVAHTLGQLRCAAAPKKIFEPVLRLLRITIPGRGILKTPFRSASCASGARTRSDRLTIPDCPQIPVDPS
jgi:hypothetical protein